MFKRLILTLLIPLAALSALAKGFEYTYKGQTLKYVVLSEEQKTCTTAYGQMKDDVIETPTGALQSNLSYIPGNDVHPSDGILYIPEKVSDGITEYTVVGIGYCGFRGSNGFKQIILPNTITSIGSYAFDPLDSFTITKSMVQIGECPFSGMSELIIESNDKRTYGPYFLYDYLGMGGYETKCRGLKKVYLSSGFGRWMGSIPDDATVYTLPQCVDDAKQYGKYTVESVPDIEITNIKSGLDNLEFQIKNDVNANIKEVTVGGRKVTSSLSTYSISGLSAQSTYTIEVEYELSPFGDCTKSQYVNTQSLQLDIAVQNTTQSTAVLKVSKVDDSRVSMPTVIIDNNEYKSQKDGTVKITGLKSNTSYTARAEVTFNGKSYYSNHISFRTAKVNPIIEAVELSPTTITLNPTYTEDDAIIESTEFSINNIKYPFEPQTVVNLPVNSNVTAYFRLNSESDSKTFTLPALELKTIAARAASKDCAIICAETNMSEEEYGGGFEWRRYDAPDLVPSTFSPCPVANGHMEGRLKGLSQNTYYKYRPYYEDCNGYRTFGEWTAFITADADVYFEPTVYTYSPRAVTANSATVVGYAMAGSEDVAEQGFEYWSLPNSRAASEVKRILVSGQRMVANLDGLEAGTAYTVRAFATTASKTTYGEDQVFTTDSSDIDAIEEVEVAEITAGETFNVYTINGVCVRRNATDLRGLRPGLYIANGRKIIVR